MRGDRHTHVLQFANDFGVVAIQLAGKLVNSKLRRHSLSIPLGPVMSGCECKPDRAQPSNNDPAEYHLFYSSIYSSGTFSCRPSSFATASGTASSGSSLLNMCCCASRFIWLW